MQEVAGSGPVYRSIERDAGSNPAGSPWAVSKAALLNLHISGKVRALCAIQKDGLGESNSSEWLREQPRYIPDTS